ncbi:MAG: hypothetical protein BroJett025_02250 [Patescibacteria group bacterium]|nr:MAG: hypothetical protein BroJett025_02250 [Patescibacteria group bacterium]
MKILILTTDTGATHTGTSVSSSTGLLLDSLKKNHEVTLALFSQLSLTIAKDSIHIAYKSTDIKLFDFIIFRSTDDTEFNMEWLAQIVGDYCLANNIKNINAQHYASFGNRWNKLQQIEFFTRNGFLVPHTKFGYIENSHFPLIAKPLIGSQGKGIHMVASKKELVPHLGTIYQEVLPNRQDYRVLVLGEKILGVMLRKANTNSVVSNISAGGIGEKSVIDPQLQEISLRLARLSRLDFCGIDLMKNKDDEYAVLEVNRNPGFLGFQKVTGIEVTAEIEAHLSAS